MAASDKWTFEVDMDMIAFWLWGIKQRDDGTLSHVLLLSIVLSMSAHLKGGLIFYSCANRIVKSVCAKTKSTGNGV